MADGILIPDAFGKIMALAFRLDIENIKDMDGCWEHQIDEHWWIAVNGHTEDAICSHGPTVSPFHCYIEFNGWPAGLIGMKDGIIAAGAAANEATFIAAIDAVLGAADD